MLLLFVGGPCEDSTTPWEHCTAATCNAAVVYAGSFKLVLHTTSGLARLLAVS